MRILPFVFVILAAPLCGAADIPLYDFRKPTRDGVILVGMECHKKNGTLEVGLFHPNEPPAKRMDLWQTSDLVRYDRGSNMVTDVFEVERRCTLGNDHYVVRLGGLPGAPNAMWQCGAVVTAKAKVWKNGRLIFDKELDRCEGGNAIRVVRFSAGSDVPRIEHFKP